jgi:hypothetical protein
MPSYALQIILLTSCMVQNMLLLLPPSVPQAQLAQALRPLAPVLEAISTAAPPRQSSHDQPFVGQGSSLAGVDGSFVGFSLLCFSQPAHYTAAGICGQFERCMLQHDDSSSCGGGLRAASHPHMAEGPGSMHAPPGRAGRAAGLGASAEAHALTTEALLMLCTAELTPMWLAPSLLAAAVWAVRDTLDSGRLERLLAAASHLLSRACTPRSELMREHASEQCTIERCMMYPPASAECGVAAGAARQSAQPQGMETTHARCVGHHVQHDGADGAEDLLAVARALAVRAQTTAQSAAAFAVLQRLSGDAAVAAARHTTAASAAAAAQWLLPGAPSRSAAPPWRRAPLPPADDCLSAAAGGPSGTPGSFAGAPSVAGAARQGRGACALCTGRGRVGLPCPEGDVVVLVEEPRTRGTVAGGAALLAARCIIQCSNSMAAAPPCAFSHPAGWRVTVHVATDACARVPPGRVPLSVRLHSLCAGHSAVRAMVVVLQDPAVCEACTRACSAGSLHACASAASARVVEENTAGAAHTRPESQRAAAEAPLRPCGAGCTTRCCWCLACACVSDGLVACMQAMQATPPGVSCASLYTVLNALQRRMPGLAAGQVIAEQVAEVGDTVETALLVQVGDGSDASWRTSHAGTISSTMHAKSVQPWLGKKVSVCCLVELSAAEAPHALTAAVQL